jgi:hypothetical protein
MIEMDINNTNFVQPSGVMGVVVDLRDKFSHYSQLSIIRANLDIEVLHVVRRALPPILGMVGSIIHIVDRWWLPVLRTSRPIKVETVHPNTSTVEHLPSMVLAERLRGIWEMEIQVSRSPEKERKEHGCSLRSVCIT